MEPKPDAKDNPTISTGNWRHNACYTQSAKTPCLCTTAIAKSNCEDNPFQRIVAIGAIVDISEINIMTRLLITLFVGLVFVVCFDVKPILSATVFKDGKISSIKKAKPSYGLVVNGRLSSEIHFAGKRPTSTVILSHGSGGVWKHQLNWADSLNGQGYNVVILDHFTQKGVKPHTGKVDIKTIPEERVKDILALSKWINSQEWHDGKIGVIGFSQGGSGVNLLANTRMLKNLKLAADYDLGVFGALVSYYPGCGIPLGGTPDLPYVPIQLHLGELDGLAEVMWCETGFRKNENLEIFIYPEAHHSFDVEVKDWKKVGFIPATGRMWEAKLNPEANELSRKRVFRHLETYLKSE